MNSDAEPEGVGRDRTSVVSAWFRIPFALRMAGAIVLGLGAGVLLGQDAHVLNLPAKIVLRLLGALAPPLVLFAILRAVLRASAGAGDAARLAWILVSNTTVAIAIGLVLANVLAPGAGAVLAGADPSGAPALVGSGLLDLFPRSVLGPLSDQGSVLQVAIVALVFGLALRASRDTPLRSLDDAVDIGFATMLRVLLWIIELLPLAVFCVTAVIAGTKGLRGFGPLGAFVGTVLLALVLQAGFYLVRVRFGSSVPPLTMLRGTRDALVSAFSTASSAATMPVTYRNLTRNVGVSDRSATLSALVGTNFNNDGTALYEAVAALFVAQALGIDLSLWQQVIVMLASITASVGAAVPEAGIVSMTLVFGAVGLPLEAIGTLLVVDWLLDRCRTATNVLGDIATACLLDGRRPREESS